MCAVYISAMASITKNNEFKNISSDFQKNLNLVTLLIYECWNHFCFSYSSHWFHKFLYFRWIIDGYSFTLPPASTDQMCLWSRFKNLFFFVFEIYVFLVFMKTIRDCRMPLTKLCFSYSTRFMLSLFSNYVCLYLYLLIWPHV